MDFKGYSELFHAAVNRRPNRSTGTRPVAPTKMPSVNKVSDDFVLGNTFLNIYENKLSEREQEAKTPKRLYLVVKAEGKNYTEDDRATFKFSSDSLRQELKDFVAKYGK